MPDWHIVLTKVAIIQTCLDRIREVTGLEPESLEDTDRSDIFALNLQRTTEAPIDLVAHSVASKHLGLLESVRDSCIIL